MGGNTWMNWMKSESLHADSGRHYELNGFNKHRIPRIQVEAITARIERHLQHVAPGAMCEITGG